MDTFIKTYVLISLWFWAGMLLSTPLRKAFGDMHWRVVKRIYDATIGQVVKAFRSCELYVKNRTQAVRVSIASRLVGDIEHQELMKKNLVAAISRARQIDPFYYGTTVDQIENLGQLICGKPLEDRQKLEAVKTAFDLSGSTMFLDIIAKMPRAQERILTAFDELEGRPPNSSINNKEYRKFIRE